MVQSRSNSHQFLLFLPLRCGAGISPLITAWTQWDVPPALVSLLVEAGLQSVTSHLSPETMAQLYNHIPRILSQKIASNETKFLTFYTGRRLEASTTFRERQTGPNLSLHRPNFKLVQVESKLQRRVVTESSAQGVKLQS